MRTAPIAAPRAAGIRSPLLSRMSDEWLARDVERGSERAFTELYERYHQPLYRYCRSIVREDADAQDALQSAFTGALAALQRGARNAPVRPWLYRIAHNESISLLRRRKRDAQHQPVEDAGAVASSAEDEAADRARWRRVLADLAQLPDRQRGALLLRELAGLSHEEIALSLGVSVGAAKQAIFEARQALADVEEGRTMSCEEVRRRISEGDRRVLRARRVRAHLRACSACDSFARAIPARQSDLRALAPGLPPAAAAALFSRVIGSASRHGGASVGTAATAGAVGKGVGLMAGLKPLAVAGLIAATAAGVTGLTHVLHHAKAAGRPTVEARAATSTPAGHASPPVPTAFGRAAAGSGHHRARVRARRSASGAQHRRHVAEAILQAPALANKGVDVAVGVETGQNQTQGSRSGLNRSQSRRNGSASHGRRRRQAVHRPTTATHVQGRRSANGSLAGQGLGSAGPLVIPIPGSTPTAPSASSH